MPLPACLFQAAQGGFVEAEGGSSVWVEAIFFNTAHPGAQMHGQRGWLQRRDIDMAVKRGWRLVILQEAETLR